MQLDFCHRHNLQGLLHLLLCRVILTLIENGVSSICLLHWGLPKFLRGKATLQKKKRYFPFFAATLPFLSVQCSVSIAFVNLNSLTDFFCQHCHSSVQLQRNISNSWFKVSSLLQGNLDLDLRRLRLLAIDDNNDQYIQIIVSCAQCTPCKASALPLHHL